MTKELLPLPAFPRKRQKCEMQSEMLASKMSHQAVINFIAKYDGKLISKEYKFISNLNNTQKSYMSSVSQCSIQLMQIINDIIDYLLTI